MSVTAYSGENYSGFFAQFGQGQYTGKEIVGCQLRSNNCDDFSIGSLRVEPNTIVAVAAGRAMTASQGARVYVGPVDVPQLSPPLAGKAMAIKVVAHRDYDSSVPVAGGGVVLKETGGRVSPPLGRGSYPASRLASDSVQFPGEKASYVAVAAGWVAILSADPNLAPDADAVVAVGPTLVDLESVGMWGRLRSLRVLLGDPFDAGKAWIAKKAHMSASASGSALGSALGSASASASGSASGSPSLKLLRPPPGIHRWGPVSGLLPLLVILLSILAVVTGVVLKNVKPAAIVGGINSHDQRR